METIKSTSEEFSAVKNVCRDIYVKKLQDYGTSWRIMRPSSITDQILIKARRIRSIEEKGTSKINEGRRPEFIGIVNYAVIGIIQLRLGAGTTISVEEATSLYDSILQEATSLMSDKNHDYDEAWRQMRITSFTDIILQKLMRTREIESHNGKTIISEGIDANYMDMINYALFALIKLDFGA
jgi:hypothetical protein